MSIGEVSGVFTNSSKSSASVKPRVPARKAVLTRTGSVGGEFECESSFIVVVEAGVRSTKQYLYWKHLVATSRSDCTEMMKQMNRGVEVYWLIRGAGRYLYLITLMVGNSRILSRHQRAFHCDVPTDWPSIGPPSVRRHRDVDQRTLPTSPMSWEPINSHVTCGS
jgi:hypothetical protein